MIAIAMSIDEESWTSIPDALQFFAVAQSCNIERRNETLRHMIQQNECVNDPTDSNYLTSSKFGSEHIFIAIDYL